MRSRRVAWVVIVLAVAGLSAADEEFERDSEVAECVSACGSARVSCETAADTDVAQCEKNAYAPCEAWCPCTQFIGAAYFACLLECEICESDAELVAQSCPDGSEARSACAAAHRRCVQNCE